MPQPLIVQGDHSILLDVHDDEAAEARNGIAPFTELEKSPEHFHTYRISPLSLWNAAAAGLSREEVITRLRRYSRFPLPGNVEHAIGELIGRYGKLRLEPGDDDYTLRLIVPDEDIRRELRSRTNLARYLREEEDPRNHPETFLVSLLDRGTVKQELIRLGYPVDDRAPLAPGETLSFSLQENTRSGAPFVLRDYQKEAALTFHGGGSPGTGYGVVVLPCGAGKTVVGIETMHLLQTSTLILTTNVAAVHQWMEELLDKTSLEKDQIGEYSGTRKEVLPVTVATYQILVWRPDRESPFPHFDIFRRRSWGLIIYDEVHLLPAPIFRVTAEIQAVRRLGLTATLVREDRCETDVFSLVGPKRYDVPWKELEQKGWIAEASCYEIRLDLPRELRTEYAVADKRRKYRLAAENYRKIEAVSQLVENHRGEAILVIGQYLNQLTELARHLEAPLITGSVPNQRREEIYRDFREGAVPVIVVSKVANFAIDLPNASVAIQVSGSFGSRQEEAQRLGRILRPSPGEHHNSTFYTLVSNHTVEEEFAANRQKFLAEQGYTYHIEHWTD
ncbi:hypothetical protein AU468_02400 [Alkalispirochaeta sphaeroplastigenens]|uniref:DNA 3'-5' helicase n=1 Tax=Alkalispirochaeta sphaeroplastigenens TaxID=1187066 RepID=A0A2S4JZ22_9SPIO|nr:DNA repair helicase XPB [Alkalispirochaeta sphaeroplastigenens]POR04768.1 hypothetical protein AU468_02400 [Alkalispirochaeta sphaeroplastigenens]